MSKNISLLMVDDSRTIHAVLGNIFADETEFQDSSFAIDAAEARQLLSEQQYDLILLDLHMPGESGMSLLEHIIATTESKVIILSSSAEPGSPERREATEKGATAFFNKSDCVANAEKLKALIREIDTGQYRKNPDDA